MSTHAHFHPKSASKLLIAFLGMFALSALFPFEVAQADEEPDPSSYLEVQIANHPNNASLGDLYLYINQFENGATYIDLSKGDSTSSGFHDNGSGRSYLVDDYKLPGSTNTQMTYHGLPNPSGHYEWNGFRMSAEMEPAYGLTFHVGFGCDTRRIYGPTGASHMYSVEYVTDQYAICLHYDAPKTIQDDGSYSPDPISYPLSLVTNYDEMTGFNQRRAEFELTFWKKGLGADQADTTSINWWGLPLYLQTWHTNDEKGTWTKEADKKWKVNDQIIRTALKTAMGTTSTYGSTWYYKPHDKFVRAYSIQGFPNLYQQQGFCPPPERWPLNLEYLSHLRTKYQCGTKGFLINGPWAHNPGEHPLWTPGTPPENVWSCVACFVPEPDADAGSIVIYWANNHPNALWDAVGVNNAVSTYGPIELKIPVGTPPAACDVTPPPPIGTGWDPVRQFILGGDPGSVGGVLTYQHGGVLKTSPTAGGMAYLIPNIQSVDTAHPTATGACCMSPADCVSGVSKDDCEKLRLGIYRGDESDCTGSPCELSGSHDYTNGIKGAARMFSYSIQNGWLTNQIPVKWQAATTDPPVAASYQIDTKSGTPIGKLDVGAMQWLQPIYGYQNASGTEVPFWEDQYGKVILDAQHLHDLVSYVAPYTDSYKFGNVLANCHTGTYNRLRIVIPDLTDACFSDFNASGSHDSSDVLILLDSWDRVYCDLDANGTTDIMDLLKLLTDWGSCTPTIME